MDEATQKLRLEQCEERRLRVMRGDGAIGIMPVEEIKEMAATYRQLGEAGNAAAWVGLGRYHLDDNGLDWSLEQAADCACRAVALGSADGRVLLTEVLPGLRAEGLDDPPGAGDAAGAVERALANDSDGQAHYLAALLAFHGFGRAASPEAAIALHQAAAGRGCALAMFELYALLSTGQGGPGRDEEATGWCLKAAEHGNLRAAYNMGAFHATGRGVEKDEKKSRDWYERASQGGHPRATAMLAYMVITGQGGEPDPERGEELFQLAEEQGFDVESFREQLDV
jgi:TPR repeat protein